MDASVLENQLKQRLRKSSNRGLAALAADDGTGEGSRAESESSSRSSSVEPSISRAPSRQNVITPTLEAKAPVAPLDPSLKLPPLASRIVNKGEASGELGPLPSKTTSKASLEKDFEIKKQFLPEAPSVTESMPKPSSELEKEAETKATRIISSKEEEDDNFSGSESDSYPEAIKDDDEWETGESKTSPNEILVKRFSQLCAQIRK